MEIKLFKKIKNHPKFLWHNIQNTNLINTFKLFKNNFLISYIYSEPRYRYSLAFVNFKDYLNEIDQKISINLCIINLYNFDADD